MLLIVKCYYKSYVFDDVFVYFLDNKWELMMEIKIWRVCNELLNCSWGFKVFLLIFREIVESVVYVYVVCDVIIVFFFLFGFVKVFGCIIIIIC